MGEALQSMWQGYSFFGRSTVQTAYLAYCLDLSGGYLLGAYTDGA
jgi:hypothetical protein